MSPAAVPTLTVSIPTFTESMNGDAPGRDCYSVKEIAWILDAAWTALDITGLGLDGLEYAAYGGPALCSVYVVGGDDGESDADLIERWNACVESARFAVLA